jgi:hypothetical protein
MSRVVALVPDIMDRSKVVIAAPDAQFVGSSSALRGALSFGPEVVVVDLARPGAVEAAAAAVAAGARVIAFGNHFQRDVLAAAREAGCHEVVPRSEFFADAEALLAPRDGDKRATPGSSARAVSPGPGPASPKPPVPAGTGTWNQPAAPARPARRPTAPPAAGPPPDQGRGDDAATSDFPEEPPEPATPAASAKPPRAPKKTAKPPA